MYNILKRFGTVVITDFYGKADYKNCYEKNFN